MTNPMQTNGQAQPAGQPNASGAAANRSAFAMPTDLFGFGPFVLAGAGLIGLIAAVLPMITIESSSFSYTDFETTTTSESFGLFSEGVSSEGVFVVVLSLLAIAAGILAVLKPVKEIHMGAGGVGVVGGLYLTFKAINIMSVAGDMAFLADGGPAIGAYLLLIAGIVLIAAGVVCVMGGLKKPSMNAGRIA